MSKSLGFTLIELMITLLIIAILLLLVMPQTSKWLKSAQIDSAMALLSKQLAMAKSEALNRNIPITLCPSENSQACDDVFHWEAGWIMFADKNRNKQRDPAESILRVNEPINRIVIVTSRYRKRVIFYPLGQALGTNATFSFCDPDHQVSAKFLVLSNHGKVRISDQHPSLSDYDC